MKQKLVEQDRQRFGNICMTQGKNVVFVWNFVFFRSYYKIKLEEETCIDLSTI